MKDILKEFKTFALKGSVLDLAIGIIIGAAFNSVVRSLVDDIIMPPVGFLIGEVDFREIFFVLGSEKYETLSEAQEAGAATLNYGIFINTLISFLITAIAVFFLVKAINTMRENKEKKPEATKVTRPCPFCLTDISRKASRCPNCTSEIISSEGK
ncbi:MAG: large conductance mechanosensitive channel protein MscL [Candidatus Paceibacterota bacterium]